MVSFSDFVDMSMQQTVQYGSREEIEDIVGTYLPGDFEDYDLTVRGVTDRKRGSSDPTQQVVTYELEDDRGRGSQFTITWQEGERQDLAFNDDPVEYLEQ
ncbi:MAG: hypothetical protein ABEJ87_03775 [Candidatus Nanohalobium sp.]